MLSDGGGLGLDWQDHPGEGPTKEATHPLHRRFTHTLLLQSCLVCMEGREILRKQFQKLLVKLSLFAIDWGGDYRAVGNHYLKYSWEYFVRKNMHDIFLDCGQPEYFR